MKTIPRTVDLFSQQLQCCLAPAYTIDHIPNSANLVSKNNQLLMALTLSALSSSVDLSLSFSPVNISLPSQSAFSNYDVADTISMTFGERATAIISNDQIMLDCSFNCYAHVGASCCLSFPTDNVVLPSQLKADATTS